MLVYLIGSLRNPEVPVVAARLRDGGIDVFEDWYSAGEHADNSWRDFEKGRGRTFVQAIKGWAAKHVFEFDRFHLERCDGAVLLLPAGRSAHLELGWMSGRGKPTFILMDDPDRWDVMVQFATGVYDNIDDLINGIKQVKL